MPTPATNSTLATAATIGAKISDTATLSGGFAPLGGHVTFQVFAPGDTTCGTPLDCCNNTFSKDADVYTLSLPDALPISAAVGTYRWVAVYSGDTNNNGVTGH